MHRADHSSVLWSGEEVIQERKNVVKGVLGGGVSDDGDSLTDAMLLVDLHEEG